MYSAETDTNREPYISTRRYSRSTADDALAENKSSGETPVDVAAIKAEHSESSYRICTSIRPMGAVSSTA